VGQIAALRLWRRSQGGLALRDPGQLHAYLWRTVCNVYVDVVRGLCGHERNGNRQPRVVPCDPQLFYWDACRPYQPGPEEEYIRAETAAEVRRAVGGLPPAYLAAMRLRLQGLEYWSASRGRMRLLYEYSSLIAGLDDPTPVRDTRLPALPANAETLFARQKDLSFGDNIYRVSLSTGPGYTAQHSTNLTGMRYGIVPVAAPGVVNVRLLVIDVDEGLIFYTISSAKAAVLPGIRAKLESSFGNRAEAVYSWFSRELAKAWPAR